MSRTTIRKSTVRHKGVYRGEPAECRCIALGVNIARYLVCCNAITVSSLSGLPLSLSLSLSLSRESARSLVTSR